VAGDVPRSLLSPTMPTRSRDGPGVGQGRTSGPWYSPTLARAFPELGQPQASLSLSHLACELWGPGTRMGTG
jgi:hypothetical protein